MTVITTKEIPHIFRNRFLRDQGGNVIANGSGGNTSTVATSFEPHYLWGQYFDDTQDISGDLSGVGSITASGVITASGITLSDFVKSPTVSGTNAVFDTGVYYSGITSNSAIINNISGDTVVLSQSLTAPTISGNSIIGNNISGTNASITSLTATTINVTNKLTTNQLEAVSGYIQTLLSEDITVDNLTVTKAAHFFKLIIDEIKATQGQVIITPANAVIDKVEIVNNNYRCYFRCKQDTKEISNTFEVNDQVVCQTFNAATGVSYNVSNTYYWRLCVGTGTTSTTLNGETVDCHYIDLSDSDKDTYSISTPTSGDNVVQLGNRNDTSRQAAIIISAYNQQFLDSTIKAPSIVQYYGINDYHLENHRRNVISRDFNEFKGNFKTSNGDDIEELIEDVTSGLTAYLHTAWANSADGSEDFTKDAAGGSYSYIGLCTNNTESDASLIYSDYTWNYYKGSNGKDGEFYRLIPIVEKAIVDKNSTLGVQFQYQIVHVSGSTATPVTATTSGYWVRVKPNNTSTYYNLSTNTTTPNYTNTSFITNYHKQTSKPTYFTVYLVSGSSADVKDQKTVSVIFDAAATLEVTDEINATVQGHSETISSHTSSIATLNANYNSITTTVESNTDNISNLSGTVTSHTSSISQLQQTSSAISSTVTSISDGDTRNLFYPSCYSSDGMANPNNQWILTDVLNGTVRCSSWGSSSMKNGKPIVNGWVSAEINSTGEIYLYSPYIALNKNYKYSLTFEGNVYNYCYLEICRYTSQARALSATSNITSVQSLATLGYSTNQYTYNESIFTFTPSTTSSYNRIRFRLTNSNSYTPVLNLKKISLYQGTTSEGISTGGFAPWINTVSQLTSQITQTSAEINIGLDRAGINLTSGKITSVADNFEWLNNDGDVVLGLDSNGDAVFKGTIKAANFYHNICVWSPSDSYWNGIYCFMGSTDSDFSAFTQYHYYTKQQVYDLTQGYYSEPPTPQFYECSGDADIIYMTSDNWTGQGNYCVNLPRPDDYEGKLVECVARTNGTSTYTTKVSCVLNNKMAIGTLYVNNGDLAISTTGTYTTVTINVPSRARFLSVKVSSTYYWFLLSEFA